MTIDYEPGESRSGLFGGNSNWRGPVWFPPNVLLADALRTLRRLPRLGSDRGADRLGAASTSARRRRRPARAAADRAVPPRCRTAGGRATAPASSRRRPAVDLRTRPSASTSTATPARASARPTRPAGPRWWPTCSAAGDAGLPSCSLEPRARPGRAARDLGDHGRAGGRQVDVGRPLGAALVRRSRRWTVSTCATRSSSGAGCWSARARPRRSTPSATSACCADFAPGARSARPVFDRSIEEPLVDAFWSADADRSRDHRRELPAAGRGRLGGGSRAARRVLVRRGREPLRHSV